MPYSEHPLSFCCSNPIITFLNCNFGLNKKAQVSGPLKIVFWLFHMYSSEQSQSTASLLVAENTLPEQLDGAALLNSLNLAPRDQAYIHPSWLAKGLSGNRQCLFSLYAQANYTIPKTNSFDTEGYKLRHQAALSPYAANLKAEGFSVYTEASNSFRYETKAGAVISAQPDIVAVRGSEAIVPDIKTGQQIQAKDIAQVKLYMALIPAVGLHGISEIPTGQLVHRGEVFTISSDEITAEFKQQVAELVSVMAAADVPPITPSVHECQWCPLRHICPSKVDAVIRGTADWL